MKESIQTSWSDCSESLFFQRSTSVVDDEQLLSVCRHAHHWPRQAEHLFLDSAHGEEAEHQSAGGNRSPALAQTKCFHVLVFGQVHHPLLAGVPRGEVQAVEFAGRAKDRTKGIRTFPQRLKLNHSVLPTWPARQWRGRPAARPPGRRRPPCDPASW